MKMSDLQPGVAYRIKQVGYTDATFHVVSLFTANSGEPAAHITWDNGNQPDFLWDATNVVSAERIESGVVYCPKCNTCLQYRLDVL